MRTLIDIPENQINELAAICQYKNLSRAEVIRQAIAAYVVNNKPAVTEQAFGLWAKHSEAIDGLDYQEQIRSEW
jgi:metal-responsive CopG/Arc/MetJ family transcriptional regulator